MTQASAGAMHWSKPRENRFFERSAKPIGSSEVLVERQLAWASRGRRWHTRWISWGSLGLPSETAPILLRCHLLTRSSFSKYGTIGGYPTLFVRKLMRQLTCLMYWRVETVQALALVK